MHPFAQRSLTEQLRNRQADPIALLTQRERSVLDLIARGMSNRQIGDELHLTEGTVKGYVSTVLAKLSWKTGPRRRCLLFSEGWDARAEIFIERWLIRSASRLPGAIPSA